VAFEAINVRENTAGMAKLQALGVRSVPVVTVGVRFVMGDRLAEVAELLAFSYTQAERLSAGELLDKLDMVLAAAARYIRQVPQEKLHGSVPETARTIREMAYHIFRIGDGFLHGCAGETVTNEYLTAAPPASLQTGVGIADLFEPLRKRLKDWRQAEGATAMQASVSTYYGLLSQYDFLERTAWHSGQHLRQLMVMVQGLGLELEGPLTAKDLKGLPLPDAIWL
jgi:hypothetical protein